MKTYACSDLHGHKNLYDQIRQFIQPDDVVYFLGDAGDRGPQSWETIKAIASDPNFIYLKGNHEDMLANAMHEQIVYDMPDYWTRALISNGGEDTINDWLADNSNREWINHLFGLDDYVVYTTKDGKTIFLTHAGFTPEHNKELPREDILIWDRQHINDKWNDGFDNVYVVHGHTPIQNFKNFNGEIEPLVYCGGHKICIDAGTYVSKAAILLDLDTFESHVFKIKEDN